MSAKTWMCVDFFLAGVNTHGALIAAVVVPNPVMCTVMAALAVALGVFGAGAYREVAS